MGDITINEIQALAIVLGAVGLGYWLGVIVMAIVYGSPRILKS
jgi:hypothetical protein